ncbi:MAG TPA: UDP-3-O-(3-hydroxymyristoyl)glucosamine N-acyltransferase [Steroidobacteraceae bacterium]|nr:UDP-3-O-(3-hydroxymyristoyl)glucosamine N-acyltransferase [Steroidobacteraceae bacterium]
MGLTLGELAVRFGCELRGDPTVPILRVGTLSGAGSGELSFLANPHYRGQLERTRAAAVVLDAASASLCPQATAALVHSNPYATYARIAALLHPEPPAVAGAAPGAHIDASARVAPSASIGAGAVIGPRCTIGERVRIGAGCVLGADVRVGDDCRLHARVTLEAGTELGARVRLQSGAVVGSDGFGFARDGAGWTKVPQLGRVRIGADAEIGANTTIDRGAIEDTIIGAGVKLDNQIQVAHNVQIGEHTVIAACTGISGSTRIGRRCMIAGAVGIVGHLDICDDVVVTGMSMVSHSISTPGVYSGGIPAAPAGLWRRLVGRFKRLDALAGRVTRLERGAHSTDTRTHDDE